MGYSNSRKRKNSDVCTGKEETEPPTHTSKGGGGIRFFSPPKSRFVPLTTPLFTSPSLNMREKRERKCMCVF